MKEYYFDSWKYEKEEATFSPFCIAKRSDKEYEEKYEFELYHFLEKMIIKEIGRPPEGSGFEIDIIDYDYDETSIRTYEDFVYFYTSERKAHVRYLEKLEEIFYLEKFERKCRREFKNEYEKFKKKKKKEDEELD